MDTTKSFVFYGSWLEDTEDMTKDELLEYFNAICAYGLNGEVMQVSGYVKGCMRMVRRDVDDNLRRREEAANAHREAGKKGGRPKNQKVLEENQNNQKVLEETKKSVNVNVNVNGDVNVDNKEINYSSLIEHDDKEHNVSGLMQTLQLLGLCEEDITKIVIACDYGKIGSPIWALLANADFKRKVIAGKINTNYIIKCLKNENNNS